MNVLISLHKGYGLGDSVQMSAVLRHVAKRRPNWTIDYRAEDGRHCVGRGIVANTFSFSETGTRDHYDAEVLITLWDKWHGFTDRPNTHVSAALFDHFDIPWDKECGRYRVEISEKAMNAAGVLVSPARCDKNRRPHSKVVAVHYQGDTAKANKDLTCSQAAQICKEVEKLDGSPLLLDWRDTSPITDDMHVRTVGRVPMAGQWGADAEMNVAVISQCAAFVGIDSGPAKCASATDTPSLIVWTGHHPAQFHDPAPNTTHLVPVGFHCLSPVNFDKGVTDWFDRHYKVRYYIGDPVREVAKWLREVMV